MNTLYELTGKWLEIQSIDDMPDDVLTDTLEAIEGEIQFKGIDVAKYFQNLEAQAEAIKQAELRMKERRQAIESKAAKLKGYLMDSMVKTGINSIECEYFKITTQKTAGKVVIDESKLHLIPEHLMRTKVINEPDKPAIKEALKDGDLPYAHLETSWSLRIK